ncbi:MAG TPA: glycosyltransferase family 39 protein [Gemmatimonadales bacterium]|nr:glycosyltransferase family 39 protein [Gemmatimonadales bacterium]
MGAVPFPSLRSNILRVFAPGRPDKHYVVALIAASSAFILLAGAARHYLAYGTETDFVGAFVQEARRFLQGAPLHSVYHPPLYSIVIGVAYLITSDWLRAGLLVSWISGVVALVASFLLFKELFNRAAGFGALLGLLGSGLFVLHWGLATSDVFFLAGFMVSCLLAVKAFRSGSMAVWAACGIAAGLCFLTRTNAISLAVLVIAPLLSAGSARAKVRSVLALVGGMALPVATLATYAAVTGSNLFPAGTHVSLAITYFAEGARNTDDARREAAARFTNLREVLLHDPAAIAKTYVSGLYHLLANGITRLIEVPLYYAILPGAIYLIAVYFSPALLVLAGVVLSQVLLVNLIFFQQRLYLFLVPWLGAAVGETFRRIADAPWPKSARPAVIGFLALVWLLASVQAGAKTVHMLSHGGEDELSEVVPLTRGKIRPGSVILAYKPHVAFYNGATTESLPDLDGLAQLKKYTQERAGTGALYIFYGMIERLRRPQYAELARGTPPPWLEVTARSRKAGGWVLLSVK